MVLKLPLPRWADHYPQVREEFKKRELFMDLQLTHKP
jgi:hypothetical protein